MPIWLQPQMMGHQSSKSQDRKEWHSKTDHGQCDCMEKKERGDGEEARAQAYGLVELEIRRRRIV